MNERRTRGTHASLLCFLALSACSNPTELMLIVKAGPGLTFGPKGNEDISILNVRVQEIDSDPQQWFYQRVVNLCPSDDAPGATCRPQKFVDKNYDGSLTLPIRLLFEPGSLGLVKDTRIEIDAISGDGKGTKVLAGAVRFRFSDGHRLWVEIPLFKQCLGVVACVDTDQICGIDTNCKTETPSARKPGDADEPAVGDMTTVAGDLSSGPLDMTLPAAIDMSTSGVVDLASATDMPMPTTDLSGSQPDMSAAMDLASHDAAVCDSGGMPCCTLACMSGQMCVWVPQMGDGGTGAPVMMCN